MCGELVASVAIYVAPELTFLRTCQGDWGQRGRSTAPAWTTLVRVWMGLWLSLPHRAHSPQW
jgi:hypothetical protein